MGRFFDPDKPGLLRKEWHKPLWAFLILLGISWAAYFAYVNQYQRTVISSCCHIVLMLLTAPFVVAGIVAAGQRNDCIRGDCVAADEAERRSRRIGWTGGALVFVGIGVGYVANEYLGRTLEGRGEMALLASPFFVPGLLLIFYAKSIDHALAFLPAGLDTQALEEWVQEKTSVGNFVRKVLLFAAAMAVLIALLWYFPEIMETNQTVMTGTIVVASLLWVFWKVRRDRERVSLVPARKRRQPEYTFEPVDTLTKLQYGLFAAGVVWAAGASDFIPRSAPPQLGYLPLSGLVLCAAAALLLRFYGMFGKGRK